MKTPVLRVQPEKWLEITGLDCTMTFADCTVIRISLGTPFGRYFLATANCLGRLNSQWETRNGPSCREPQYERMIGLAGFQATNQHFGGQCLPQTSTTHGPIRGPLTNYNCRKIKTRKN